MTRLERSKWTAQQPRRGWQHFEFVSLRGKGADAVATLRAVVERGVTIEVPLRELLDPAQFRPGWLPLPLAS